MKSGNIWKRKAWDYANRTDDRSGKSGRRRICRAVRGGWISASDVLYHRFGNACFPGAGTQLFGLYRVGNPWIVEL